MEDLRSNISRMISLYRDDGYSMSMISEKLEVSISKVRYWLDKNNINRRNRSDAGYLTHSNRFNRYPCNIKEKLAKKEKELLIAGIMLYWAEGWKKNSNYVSFSNSDASMIQIFLNFLRRICRVDDSRLRILLHFYDNQDEAELKKYWSKVTNIPLRQFNKSFVHKGKTGNYKKKSEYGTVNIRYGDKKLLNQIIRRIDDFKNSVPE